MDDKLSIRLENEVEWRKFLMKDIAEIKKDQKVLLDSMSNLKVKVAFISSGIAICAGIVSSVIVNKIH